MRKIGVVRIQLDETKLDKEKGETLGLAIQNQILKTASEGFVPLFPIQAGSELLIVVEAETQVINGPLAATPFGRR